MRSPNFLGVTGLNQHATIAAPAPRAFISRGTRETLANYAYLSLAGGPLSGGTVLFPILKPIHMSLYHNVLSRPQDYRFIGFGNYLRMIHYPAFWLTRKNSFVWVFFSVSIQFVLGFLGALLLNAEFKGGSSRALYALSSHKERVSKLRQTAKGGS